MASLPLILLIGGAFGVVVVALWAARRMQFTGKGQRNRPAEGCAAFSVQRQDPPAARSGRRMLAPENASVSRRRGRQHAVPVSR